MDERIQFGLGIALNGLGLGLLVTALVFWPDPATVDDSLLLVSRTIAGIFGLTFMMAGGYAANNSWQAVQ